jgi:hypothetical protein
VNVAPTPCARRHLARLVDVIDRAFAPSTIAARARAAGVRFLGLFGDGEVGEVDSAVGPHGRTRSPRESGHEDEGALPEGEFRVDEESREPEHRAPSRQGRGRSELQIERMDRISPLQVARILLKASRLQYRPSAT